MQQDQTLARLQKLEEFIQKGKNAKEALAQAAQAAQLTDQEFMNWLQSEFNIKGELHLSDILKAALEQSCGPKLIIS